MKAIRFAASAICCFSGLFSASASNLVVNGDFAESAFTPTWVTGWSQVTYTNPGFISDYLSYHPVGGLYNEGTYVIGTDAKQGNHNFLTFGDVTGEGKMLIVNGATGAAALNDVVWSQTFSGVTTGTTYSFQASLRNVNDYASWGGNYSGWKSSQSILQFQVLSGGSWINLGSPIDFTSPSVNPDVWNTLNFTWNSGSNTSSGLRLLNLQTSGYGNDFAMDGIVFTPSSTSVPEPRLSALVALSISAVALRRRRGE